MDEGTRSELLANILIAVHGIVGTDTEWTDELQETAIAEATRLGGDRWDALEALMTLHQRGHLETTPDYARGRLTASGVWLARTTAVV
jgi:hypothetical protein